MNPYSELEDEQLLAQCKIELRRSSGPGGQHRNKVESGVRLTHEPTGLVINATERRSQLANRRLALARLKAKLEDMFTPVAERVPTRKSKAVRARERGARMRIAERKRARVRPDQDD